MELTPYSENWYALFVKTGEEDRVKLRLEYRMDDAFRVLVPKRKLKERRGGAWFERIRTLFPGYVLLNGEMDVQKYYHMKNVPGILRFLKSGCDFFKMEDNEIEVLSQLLYYNEIIDFSELLIENGRVVVVDGPLTSLEGLIIDVNPRKGRARVRLDFLGEERVVELGVSLLQPA